MRALAAVGLFTIVVVGGVDAAAARCRALRAIRSSRPSTSCRCAGAASSSRAADRYKPQEFASAARTGRACSSARRPRRFVRSSRATDPCCGSRPFGGGIFGRPLYFGGGRPRLVGADDGERTPSTWRPARRVGAITRRADRVAAGLRRRGDLLHERRESRLCPRGASRQVELAVRPRVPGELHHPWLSVAAGFRQRCLRRLLRRLPGRPTASSGDVVWARSLAGDQSASSTSTRRRRLRRGALCLRVRDRGLRARPLRRRD